MHRVDNRTEPGRAATHAPSRHPAPATMTVALAIPDGSPPALQSRATALLLTPIDVKRAGHRAGQGRETPAEPAGARPGVPSSWPGRSGAGPWPQQWWELINPGTTIDQNAAVRAARRAGEMEYAPREPPPIPGQPCPTPPPGDLPAPAPPIPPPKPTAARPPPQPHGRTVTSAPTDPAPRRVDGGKPR